MPFTHLPKPRASATARACRAVAAARLAEPGSEWRVFRALQLANFTTPLLLDDDRELEEVLRTVPGIDAERIIGMLDDPAVTGACEKNRAEARSAAGSAAELQGKTATTDGPVRYTAPSVSFSRQRSAPGRVANLDPGIERQPAPETPAPLLERFPDGLTTQEVAALLARGNDALWKPA